VCEQVRAQLGDLLDGGTAMMLPTCVGPVPLLSEDWQERGPFVRGSLLFCSVAGLVGFPQFTTPAVSVG
jgi:hypothetical protein